MPNITITDDADNVYANATGWKGPTRNTYAEARKDARMHRLG